MADATISRGEFKAATYPDANTDTTAQGIILAQLNEWGLGGLGAWAWQRFKETGSVDLVKMEMEEKPEYKARFAGRLALREKGYHMSEAEQMGYENQAMQLFREAGMPPDFYDQPSDFTDAISAGISVVELGHRVNEAYVKVQQAPAAIRTAMNEYYGVNGDAALAAWALDKTKAEPMIMRAVAASEAGGYLAQQHVHIARSLAEQLAAATHNDTSRIEAASREVGTTAASGLLDERINQKTSALDEGTAISASFEGNAAAALALQKEQETRAASGAGSEHFDTSNSGISGLGGGRNR